MDKIDIDINVDSQLPVHRHKHPAKVCNSDSSSKLSSIAYIRHKSMYPSTPPALSAGILWTFRRISYRLKLFNNPTRISKTLESNSNDVRLLERIWRIVCVFKSRISIDACGAFYFLGRECFSFWREKVLISFPGKFSRETNKGVKPRTRRNERMIRWF